MQKDALRGISLHLNEGDFVTVIGGNGAGKSTMLNAIAGVFPVDEGYVKIDGNKYPASISGRLMEVYIRSFASTLVELFIGGITRRVIGFSSYIFAYC